MRLPRPPPAAAAAVAIHAGGAAVALIAAILLARLLGPAGYGAYVFGISIAGLMAIVASLGTPNLAIRETGRLGRALESMLAFRAWALGRIAWGMLLAALLLLAAAAWAPVANEFRAPLAIAAVLAGALALLDFGSALLRGLGRIRQALFFGGPFRNLALLVVVGIAWFGIVQATASVFLSAMVASTLVAAGVVLILGRRRIGASASERLAEPDSSWRRGAWWMLALAGAWALQANLDVLLLGLLGTPADVGVYGAAQRGAALVQIPFAALNAAAAPALAASLQDGRQAAQVVISRASRWNLLLTVPVAFGLAISGPWLLQVLGAGFQVAYAPMVILCVAQVVTAMLSPAGLALTYSGHEKKAVGGLILAACVNVGAALALIPAFGAWGAALATALAVCTWNVSHAIHARNRLGLKSIPFGTD